MSMGHASGIQVSVQQASMIVMEIDRNLDLRVIPLLEGSLHVEADEANTQLGQIKDVGVNLATGAIR